MNLLLALVAIFFMTLIGFALIKIGNMLNGLTDFEIAPYAFGLGGGIFAFQLYLYSRIGWEWQTFSLLLPWLVLLVIAYVKGVLKFGYRKSRANPTVTEYILRILIGATVLFVFFESIMRPVVAWDAWSSWLLRAKMFFIERGVTPETFTYIPSEYPVLVSLMSTYLYIFMGKIDDTNVLILYPVFFMFLGVAFFNSLKFYTGRKLAMLFTFLLLSLQNVIRHSGRFEAGQADIILGFYAFISMTLFLLYRRKKSIRTLLLLQVFLPITSLIKDDGITIVFFIEAMLIFTILRNKTYKHITTMVIWLLPFAEWQFFKVNLMLPSTPSYLGNEFHPERIPLILTEFTKEFFNFSNWNFLWVAFFVSFFIFIALMKKNIHFTSIYCIVIFQIVVYACVFLFTSPDPQFHIPNVINRAFLHIAPIALFAVALNVAIMRKLKNVKV